MAIEEQAAVFQTGIFPQGDARDPLGVWVVRHGITGDGGGGGIKVQFQVPGERRAAYIYTCYSLNVSQSLGPPSAAVAKARLLTRWPDASIEAGVAGYATLVVANQNSSSALTAPAGGTETPLLFPNDRFVLLWDPRSNILPMDIVELEINVNVNTNQYTFEGYGYYWDRAVMNTPGGPRHPGSS